MLPFSTPSEQDLATRPNARSRFTQTTVPVLILLALGAFVAWSYFGDGIIGIVLRGGSTTSERINLLKDYFASWGTMAPVVYLVIVIIEVVIAPIPGLMLYAPGGIVFGGFWGGLLALTGNVLGAGISCQLMRVLGRSRLKRILEGENFSRLDERLAGAGVWVVFALRVNPLTSTDLVSYAAGLTAIPVWKVMLGTLLGMAPLCWAQAFLAEELLQKFPALIYPLIVLCVIYLVIVVFIVRRILAPVRAIQ